MNIFRNYRYIFNVISLNLRPSTVFYSAQKSNSKLHNLLKKMPKEPQHIQAAQKQRQKIKEKQHKYVSGTVRIQVLGTGAEGAPRALYIFTDHSRYLFNCGEGTQRLAHEHKMKLSRLEHIFITQPVWLNMGGLPGLALTIQDVGVSNINLHGPDGLDELFSATRRFVVLKDLQVTMAECEEPFQDNLMTVDYVKIIKPSSQIATPEKIITNPHDSGNSSPQPVRAWNRRRSISESSPGEDTSDTIDYYAQESKRKARKRYRYRSCSFNSRTDSTSSGGKLVSGCSQVRFPVIPNEPREQNMVMNYICKLRARPGELSLVKCVEKGVPPGPLLGKLKNGEDVQLANGTIVRSVDVCNPDDPGPIFMVVDCPSIEFLDSFLSNEKWSKYQSTAKSDQDVTTVVYHFTPPHILKNVRYQEWINKFSPSTQHICLNSDSSCLGSASVFKVQNQLNLIDNFIFPRLQTEIVENSLENQSQSNAIVSKTLWSYHLRPKKGLDRSNEILSTLKEDVIEAIETEGFQTMIENLKKDIDNVRKTSSQLNSSFSPSILFLGTGSCIPNKTRNTSGILVKTSSDSYILLDCGEGTFGQLVRFYGTEGVIPILSKLKAIYVSHLHADHHIGLVGFLTGRRDLLTRVNIPCERIYLFAPKQISWWLNMYNIRFENISNELVLISNTSLNLGNHSCPNEYEKEMLEKIKLLSIDTIPVRHCPNAFGVAIQTLSDHKITYSGDTMPCQDLVQLGMNSDLLIHEATMEDELEHEAKIKMHSTTSQAIQIGKDMNAKFILLTHFSQRYARVPRISVNIANNVGIAFDNMHVSISDLEVLPLLYPALKILFHDHCEQLENKAAKRHAKAIRNKEGEKKSKKKKSTDSESSTDASLRPTSTIETMEIEHPNRVDL